jgi:prepilin-type N-terminal cleavage/methylation domain-containing protein
VKRRRCGDRGLSLVEVMIALGLLSVALIALISKVHGCIDTARVTEYQNAAREYAKELMAEIEAGTIDGLFDGAVGDFADRGYPHLRYAVRIGESSSASPLDEESQQGLYKQTQASASASEAPDPKETSAADEPYTRIQITVEYPTAEGDKAATFILEKMVPTECTQGSRGIEEKRKKDADAAAAESSAPPPSGAVPSGGAGGAQAGAAPGMIPKKP